MEGKSYFRFLKLVGGGGGRKKHVGGPGVVGVGFLFFYFFCVFNQIRLKGVRDKNIYLNKQKISCPGGVCVVVFKIKKTK